MIWIDYKDRRPIYEQIVDKVEQLILQGVFPPDSQMPSVRSLSIELSINPNTIQKAYAELERRGFLYTVKGKGSFVSFQESLLEEKKEAWKQDLKKLVEAGKLLQISAEEMKDCINVMYEQQVNEDA